MELIDRPAGYSGGFSLFDTLEYCKFLQLKGIPSSEIPGGFAIVVFSVHMGESKN